MLGRPEVLRRRADRCPLLPQASRTDRAITEALRKAQTPYTAGLGEAYG